MGCTTEQETRSSPIAWARQNGMPLKSDLKSSEAAFSAVFNFDKCQSEICGDVMSGVAVDWVRVDVRVKFGDSRLQMAELFDSLTDVPVFCTFLQYLIGFILQLTRGN